MVRFWSLVLASASLLVSASALAAPVTGHLAPITPVPSRAHVVRRIYFPNVPHPTLPKASPGGAPHAPGLAPPPRVAPPRITIRPRVEVGRALARQAAVVDHEASEAAAAVEWYDRAKQKVATHEKAVAQTKQRLVNAEKALASTPNTTASNSAKREPREVHDLREEVDHLRLELADHERNLAGSQEELASADKQVRATSAAHADAKAKYTAHVIELWLATPNAATPSAVLPPPPASLHPPVPEETE